ncbi:hypothetical protein JR316_0004531 [Psilocybe cubensis]|uniref:Uncharacterized protein n=2 Tax=Psilocybe cubensis TaxID=181762 RepID=A0ACB8H3L2_PSICU|nr:hypothetical protein JR316_0004531 [Psilocybe cubensis]KAH9482431.1 hypothetical protein JR316_0004531 [Psilocybe cubensis]
MPLLGEAPITLYMEKKPKANGDSGNISSKPPLKKRKIETSGHNKDMMREHKTSVSRTKPTILTFFGSSKAASDDDTASGSQTPGHITPKILRKRTKGVESSHIQLRTPPLTNEGSSQQYRLTSLPSDRPELSCINGSKKSTRSRSTLYSSPTTMPRQTLDPCSRNFLYTQETECKRTIDQSTFSLSILDPLNEEVPSSQTQPLAIKIANSPSKENPAPQEREEHSFTPADDVDFLVESSQSQPPLSVSEERGENLVDTSKDGHGHAKDSASYECIPSSQSQEIELSIPDMTCNQNDFTLERTKPLSHALFLKKSAGRINRSLSDELFPVPIQYGVLDQNFKSENSSLCIEQESHTLQFRQGGAEVSGTESDSQYEAFVKQLRDRSKSTREYVNKTITESSSQCEEPVRHHLSFIPKLYTTSSVKCDHPSHDSQILCPIKHKPIPLSQDSGYEASQGEDFNDGYRLADSVTQPVDASQENSLQSSPVDLLAFFGNTQDSYPPDFPMSLR